MAWSHLHPALIHLVVGLGTALLVWDLSQLKKEGGGSFKGVRTNFMEGWLALILLAVGTGWIALTNDRILQFAGKPFGPGEIHGNMGVAVLGLATIRTLGMAAPDSPGFRRLLAGIDGILLGLLLGTALLGEWLVFDKGLGLSGLAF